MFLGKIALLLVRELLVVAAGVMQELNLSFLIMVFRPIFLLSSPVEILEIDIASMPTSGS